MQACSFFIKSSSKLLVTRTSIKAGISLIWGWIRLLTLEILALEWRKFYTLELECLWGQLASLDQILSSLGVGKGCIMFWGDPSNGPVDQWSVFRRPHFQTWISLKPVGQSWSNFMCSITGVGEMLPVIFFTFWGVVPVPVELGKITAFFHKLGKIVNLNSEEIW